MREINEHLNTIRKKVINIEIDNTRTITGHNTAA